MKRTLLILAAAVVVGVVVGYAAHEAIGMIVGAVLTMLGLSSLRKRQTNDVVTHDTPNVDDEPEPDTTALEDENAQIDETLDAVTDAAIAHDVDPDVVADLVERADDTRE